MKKTSVGFSIALLAACGASAALAQTGGSGPTVTVVAPTTGTTLYSASFPFTQTVQFKVAHVETLAKVQVLNVSVNGVTIVNGGAPVGNPFGNDSACTAPLTTAPNTCFNSDGLYEATLTVPWTIPAPGSYPLAISAKYRGATGLDEETILVAQAAVEYPAPPAVANHYINGDATLRALSGKRRGCVIAQVAERHAQLSYYGPKGGPYMESLIQNDVWNFSAGCR